MFTIVINPEDYVYMLYACKYYNAELMPSHVKGIYDIVCLIRCTPDVLFRIGRMFERKKIEAENSKDEGGEENE